MGRHHAVQLLLLGISNGFAPQLLVLTEDACTGTLLADACYEGYSVLIGSTLAAVAGSTLTLAQSNICVPKFL